ncbi:MAG: hypothetical protein M3R23_02165 [Actinomycetota bacterium]|nr:hypothetical protein [Actinomycetota bacterium]
MPLTDDQRAMLQLLLQRGQSYADIGSLLGLDVEGVQSRARAALTEIGGQDPDRDVSLTDYLLGQADPIGRADAARQLQADGEARDLAERLVTQLRVLAPGADLPDLPGADSSAAKRKDAPAPAPSGEVADSAPTRRPFGELASTLSRGQRQAIAGLFGAGILIVVGVLALAGVFDSGGGGDNSSSSSNNSSQQASSNASGLTRAVLDSQNGSSAQGVAVFAQVRNTPVLQINVTHLKPSGPGEGYVIWLYGGPTQAFPLVRQAVGKNGQLRGAAPIPTQLIQALQQGLFNSIDVSLAKKSQVVSALNQARKGQKLPPYTGQSVARGTITGPGFPASGNSSSSSGQ